MKLPTIGKMRERLTIRTPTVATDTMGQQVETFGDPFDVWAQVTEQPGGEQQGDEVTEAKRAIVAVLRHNSTKAYTTRMTVEWRGAVFNVKGVRWLDGPKRFIELTAEVAS